MIFMDIHEAFDSLGWDFIVYFLEAFNFGTNFVAWAKYFKTKWCGLTCAYFVHFWLLTKSSMSIYIMYKT